MCFKPVSLPDQLIDECRAFALSVFVLLAEDELVDVRDQLDGLADDEEDGDRDLKQVGFTNVHQSRMWKIHAFFRPAWTNQGVAYDYQGKNDIFLLKLKMYVESCVPTWL